MEPILCIINSIYRSGDLDRMIGPFRLPAELSQDLKHEIVIIIAEYHRKEFLITLYRKDKEGFMRFVYKIIKNNICSTTSPFWKKYRKWDFKRSDLNERFR